ncbi:fas-binding factor 1 homolog [Pieris brassicae]|uniref:fas-binding factor 1 homolog n=1 Tax=Pieris brassicae TaxID=7116 RepID=UPI001E66185C|nr:fas-binding factor 1 homolog [Pieris brassicae]
MSFSADDPLAGILSDGSDDSFFDEDILSKKKPDKKKDIISSIEKKNTLFDLDERQRTKPSDNTYTANKIKDNVESQKTSSKIENKSVSPAAIRRSFSKEEIYFTKEKPNATLPDYFQSPIKPNVSKKIDLLGDLIEEKTIPKPLERGKSSQSLLDDILGGATVKTQISRPATSTKNQDINLDSVIGKNESKQTLISNIVPTSSKQELKPDNSRTSKLKKKSDDWLGIFQESEESIKEDTDMPSWLTGGKTKKLEKETKSTEPVKESIVETHTETKEISNVETPQLKFLNLEVNDDLTSEGFTMCLQQQEAQLQIALQLKAQDDKLAAMQMRQKETQKVQRETTMVHHQQLDAMLRRQAEHRRQMQTIIASHQDRITQRIKALLVNNEDVAVGVVDGEVDPTEIKESPYTREKKQLLQLVESLQQNHDKEIDLMETSYRRQLDFLEVSFNQAEERMKDETDKLVKFYTEKISWLDDHHQLYKKMSEENLNSIIERHKAENDVLRQQHLDNIKVLQEHHASLIENIKHAVKQEQVLIKDSAEFSLDLQGLVVDVKDNNEKCQQLFSKMSALMKETQRDSEGSLQIREKHITDIIDQLKKDREDFEKEKMESKDIVKMLENRLRQMTTMMEEETASLRQKKMEFEFEKATFSKQTEFAKNVLKKQDEEVKMLKDEIQKEYQEKISRLDEERAKIMKESGLVAKEKASIQSLKLEIEKTKAELDARLQEVTEERSKLNADKQAIYIEEQRITAKSRDLDLLAKSAIEKQSQADKKLSEANFIQQKYEDRIHRIQEHVISLNLREKQIAKEKVALSRERLSLHNERKQLDEKQCSLCRTNVQPLPFHTDFGISREFSHMSFVPKDFSMNRDFNLSRDYGNDIETEMSNFNNEGRQDEDIAEGVQGQGSNRYKSYMDPKLMMLRLDVQKVINNLQQSKKNEELIVHDQDNG